MAMQELDGRPVRVILVAQNPPAVSNPSTSQSQRPATKNCLGCFWARHYRRNGKYQLTDNCQLLVVTNRQYRCLSNYAFPIQLVLIWATQKNLDFSYGHKIIRHTGTPSSRSSFNICCTNMWIPSVWWKHVQYTVLDWLMGYGISWNKLERYPGVGYCHFWF